MTIQFNFSTNPIKSKEELAAAMEKAGGDGPKYLQPGIHEVVIKSAEYKGAAKDARWQKLRLEFESMGKTITETVLVPTSTLEYMGESGKPTMFLFQKLTKFCMALGIDLGDEPKTIEAAIKENFIKPEKTLVGSSLRVTVGYQGNHIAWLGKSATGEKQYAIQMKDGSRLATENGKTLVFSDFEAALGHCEQNQIEVEKFANVVDHAKSSTPTTRKTANW